MVFYKEQNLYHKKNQKASVKKKEKVNALVASITSLNR